MNNLNLPQDCSKQWEVLLLLLSSEEKKIDRTSENEVEVMNYFYKNEGLRKILQQWLRQMYSSYAKKTTSTDTATKKDDISLYWRQKGNESFRNNKIDDSYRCYTKSVLYAETGGPMYPLALANRSATLLRLKKYQNCLSDIQLALDNRYPDEQRHKLFLRQADCWTELRNASKAKIAVDVAKRHANGLKLPMAHANEFDRHLKLVEKKLEMLGDVNEYEEEVQLPPCLGGENQDFVNSSNVLDLRRSETSGRHVVARAPARRGDVLFSEEPYACVALPLDGDLPVVCEQCCRQDLTPVPCKVCSRSVYCGESCRDAAWAAHHHWECVGAQSKLYPTIGIAHLALRVVLISASRGFPNPTSDTTKRAMDAAKLFASYSKCDPVKIYSADVDPFYRMFNLVTNFDKMSNVDYVQYALTAAMLTLYLEMYTTFFTELQTRLPCNMAIGQVKLLTAALVLRSLGQLVCNGHAALSLASCEQDDSVDTKTMTERELRHATAIYPSAAMMNHSCDPNIINTFYRNRLIVRCGGDLSAGGEVLNCYGPHRAREPAADRRALLRAQYAFNCACAACTDTQRKDAVLLFSAYACQSCKGPVWMCARRPQCAQCRRPEPQPERAAAAVRRADEIDMQADRATTAEERLDKLHAAYKMKQQVLHRHNASLRLAADRLARVYAEMGEFTKSVELIKQNIQSLEYQYGSFSVEVAHELRKLSDVMLERIYHSPQHVDHRDWCLETHKIIKKAFQLMELNYGSWEPLVKRLKQQEVTVAALLADSRSRDEVDCVHHNLHYNLKI